MSFSHSRVLFIIITMVLFWSYKKENCYLLRSQCKGKIDENSDLLHATCTTIYLKTEIFCIYWVEHSIFSLLKNRFISLLSHPWKLNRQCTLWTHEKNLEFCNRTMETNFNYLLWQLFLLLLTQLLQSLFTKLNW